jgi:hypothetical protein
MLGRVRRSVASPEVSMFEQWLEKYRRVGAKLGLGSEGDLPSGTFRVFGTFEGVPVQMYFVTDAVCTAAGYAARPELGLHVATKGVLRKLANLFGSGHGPLGDETFDKVFSVKANDLAQAAQVLRPDLRTALLELAGQDTHPAIDDQWVRMWRYTSAAWEPEETIEYDLVAVARVGRLLTDAARS